MNEPDGLPPAPYSCRNAAIGSTRTARRAGTQHAHMPMTTTIPMTETRVMGSCGDVFHN